MKPTTNINRRRVTDIDLGGAFGECITIRVTFSLVKPAPYRRLQIGNLPGDASFVKQKSRCRPKKLPKSG